MTWLGQAREHWRVTLLIVMLVASLFILFAPLEGLQPPEVDEGGSQGITNLQWGLELAGGTSVRAPLIGYIAEDLEIERGEETAVAIDVATELGVNERDVTVRDDGSVEVTDSDVDREAFLSALQAAGLDATDEDVRRGVHEETRDQTRDILEEKVNEAGLSGSTVSIARSPGGEYFIEVEVPNADQSEVLELIGDRGLVEVVAHFPDEVDNETAYRNETVLRQGDFARIDPAEPGDAGQLPHVPVVVRSAVAEDFQGDMRSFGFAQQGGTSCTWEVPEERPDDPGRCLLTVVDGEVVYAAGVNSGLADSFRDGSFADRPQFIMTTTAFSDAQTLSLNLRAGALPAELDFGAGTLFFLEPSLAEDFRLFSLLVGLLAGLAVAGMVYWRYRDPRVAAPMLLTASGEVIILLAMAVMVPIPLDLAHVAGFVAVLGTGVDDLVIIADEIMQRGEIRTGRVFESRFRKAFWVIGVAAVTTIVAMTPLVYLSLGDLTGFAIVTIIGVLVGVLITRPAYGNILRILMLE